MGSLPVSGRAVTVGRRALRGILGVACAGALALGAAGCAGGGDPATGAAAAAPADVALPVAAPVATGPLAPGQEVHPGQGTPRAVARALRAGRPLVIAFVLRGAADDDAVRAALTEVRSRRGTARGVTYVVYDVSTRRDFGTLPAQLGVTGTPTVVVVGRDRSVVNVWTGLVDASMLRQSVLIARESSGR